MVASARPLSLHDRYTSPKSTAPGDGVSAGRRLAGFGQPASERSSTETAACGSEIAAPGLASRRLAAAAWIAGARRFAAAGAAVRLLCRPLAASAGPQL